MNVSEIRKVFEENEVPLTKEDCWKVQQAWVIKHSALERLAAKLGIWFQDPIMMQGPHQANWDGASYAMLVVGSRTIGERNFSEWSIGEVSASNYRTSGKQPAYPWAMVEKRGKDRVIIKLSGLHGLYSEDEADDFAARNKPQAQPEPEPQPEAPAAKAAPARAKATEKAEKIVKEAAAPQVEDPFSGLSEEQREIIDTVAEIGSVDEVGDYMMSPDVQDILKASNERDRNMIRGYAHERVKALGWLAPKGRKEE